MKIFKRMLYIFISIFKIIFIENYLKARRIGTSIFIFVMPKYSKFTELMIKVKNENLRMQFFDIAYNSLPDKIKKHREFFLQENRGFGENAFHAMWFYLISEFRPRSLAEIGVYRGQAISLWALIYEHLDIVQPDIYGISPLKNSGDTVSTYLAKLDYKTDIYHNFDFFNLPRPRLIETASQGELSKEFFQTHNLELIYVDGSHDYAIVKQDVDLIIKTQKSGCIVVMDDASLYSSYKPSRNSFAGHFGPSMVLNTNYFKDYFFELGTCGHNRIYMLQ